MPATHSRRSSLSCFTLSTPSINCGKSSNCVHWLYAVLTGTFTNTDFSTFVVMTSSSAHDSNTSHAVVLAVPLYLSDLVPRSECTKPTSGPHLKFFYGWLS